MIDDTVKRLIEFEDMINSKEWQSQLKPATYKKKADEKNKEHKKLKEAKND